VTAPADMLALVTRQRVETFLFREAALLDDRQFDEWLALFDANGEYWIPMSSDQPDPYNHISLLFETVDIMKMRVRRLHDKTAPAQRPASRTLHQISNVMIGVAEGSPDQLDVRSALTMIEYRRSEQRIFAGYMRHRLAPHGESFKIVRKRVDLLNNDSDAGHLRLSVPF
jgi:3-phenylpropionate/cinnamic acid dioxygenase small subunit